MISLFEEWGNGIHNINNNEVLIDFPGEILNAVVLAHLAETANPNEAKAIMVHPFGNSFLLEGDPVIRVVNRLANNLINTNLQKQKNKPTSASIEPTLSKGTKLSEDKVFKDFKNKLAYLTVQNFGGKIVGTYGKNVLYAFYPVPITETTLLDVKEFMRALANNIPSRFMKFVEAKFERKNKGSKGDSKTLLEILGEAMKIFIKTWLPNRGKWYMDWELVLVLPSEGVSISKNRNFNYSVFRMQLPLYLKRAELGAKVTLTSTYAFLNLGRGFSLPKKVEDKVTRNLNLYLATGEMTYLTVAMMEIYNSI